MNLQVEQRNLDERFRIMICIGSSKMLSILLILIAWFSSTDGSLWKLLQSCYGSCQRGEKSSVTKKENNALSSGFKIVESTKCNNVILFVICQGRVVTLMYGKRIIHIVCNLFF